MLSAVRRRKTEKTEPSKNEPMGKSIVICKGICKAYGDRSVLDGISLEVGNGRITGIFGEQGSGKSELIRIIAGISLPDSGVLSVLGNQTGPLTKGRVSYLPYQSYLDRKLKVSEYLSFFNSFYGDFDKAAAAAALEEVKIAANSKIYTLSEAAQQCVQVILALSRRAELYLLDEPFAAADITMRSIITESLLKHQSRGAAVLLATEQLFETETLLDDVVIMRGGKILLCADAEDLRTNYGKPVYEVYKEVYHAR